MVEDFICRIHSNGWLTIDKLLISFSLVSYYRYGNIPSVIKINRDSDDYSAGYIEVELGKRVFKLSQCSGGYFVEMVNRFDECMEHFGDQDAFFGLNSLFDKAEDMAFCD